MKQIFVKATLRVGAFLNGAALIGMIMVITAYSPTILYGQTDMKRNRGERYYNCLTSNTEGPGNIWLYLSGVGSVWDESRGSIETAAEKREGIWMSNTRAFPEARIIAGLFDFAMLTIETRPLTWGFKIPGSIGASLKLTWPDNKELRLFGLGIMTKYQYNFIDGPPTLGGYEGFMPEGFVAEGGEFESRVLFDVDCIARMSTVPLRIIGNAGMRLPLNPLLRDKLQYLFDGGIVFLGYNYDLFATFSIEAFDNFLQPIMFSQNDKRFLVWFSENPMFLVLGGNVRYKNGVTLSVAVPLLVSTNVGSKMSRDYQTALHRQDSTRYPEIAEEIRRGIKDPFDPWFTKWKISATLSFPINYTMTSAEMMRNFLLLKNSGRKNRMNLENRLQVLDQFDPPVPSSEERKKEKREKSKKTNDGSRKKSE